MSDEALLLRERPIENRELELRRGRCGVTCLDSALAESITPSDEIAVDASANTVSVSDDGSGDSNGLVLSSVLCPPMGLSTQSGSTQRVRGQRRRGGGSISSCWEETRVFILMVSWEQFNTRLLSLGRAALHWQFSQHCQKFY